MDKKIVKNLSWLVVANSLTKPLWFVFVIYSANILGVNDFGVYTFSVSFLLMFSMMLDMGLEQLLIRDVARNRNNLNSYFNNSITYKVIASSLLIVILLVIIYTSDYSEKIRYSLAIMTLFVISTSFMSFFRAFFRASEKIKYESISIIIEKTGAIFFAIIGLLLSAKLYGFLTGLVLGNFVSLGYCAVTLFRKEKDLVFSPKFVMIKNLLKDALPFLVADIFVIIYFRLSSVMIMFITGSEAQVGLYNSSYRLIEMYVALPTLFVTPVYPFISRTFNQDKEKCIEIASKIFKVLFVIAVPLSAVIFMDYIRVNQFLFSREFAGGAAGLQILILTIIPLSINVLFGTILAAIGRQKDAAISVGIGSLLNLILNYILISKLSYLGACFTIVITELSIALMYSYFIRKYFGKLSLNIFIIKILIVSILLGGFSYIMGYLEIKILTSLILDGVLFVILIFSFGLFRISQFSEYYKMMKE